MLKYFMLLTTLVLAASSGKFKIEQVNSKKDLGIKSMIYCHASPSAKFQSQKQKILIKKAQKRLKFESKIRPNFGPLDSNFSFLGPTLSPSSTQEFSIFDSFCIDFIH
jgi:hypothetical protein